MALKKTKNLTTLIVSFFLACIALFCQTAIFPNFRLIFFAPFLVFYYFNFSFISSLWISALCGIIVDSLSSTAFGVYALNYTIVTALLYREKRFFNDDPISLASFTMILSTAFSIIFPILLFIFDKPISITGKWVITDLMIMPMVDGIYSLIWFWALLKLFEQLSGLIKKRYERD
ncbi:MAG: rod shape-determining protein MreD [Chlamydiae bacterium]|nr:rod shape-determining protein MreD [Chlamydiota bacterium]